MTLRLGIAGLGALASGTVPAVVRHADMEITAVADVRPEVLDSFREDHDVETFADVDTMCRSANVDAVFVATPTQFHMENVLSAVQNGKHVLAAKPLAVTLDEAAAMVAAAERVGVILVEGHPQSLDAPLRAIRELVRDGQYGRLRMMHNWQYGDWLYRPRLPEELDTNLGGGVTYRQGAHQVDILRMRGGGLVRSVRAVTGVWDEARPTEGAHTMFLEFEDGVAATAVFSGYGHFRVTELTYGISEGGGIAREPYGAARRGLREAAAGGGEASLKKLRGYGSGGDRPRGRERHLPFYGLTLVSCDRADIRQSPDGLIVYGDDAIDEVAVDPSIDGRDAMLNELYDAVAGTRPAVHSGRWAKANLEVCVAALESSRDRREVVLQHQVAAPD